MNRPACQLVYADPERSGQLTLTTSQPPPPRSRTWNAASLSAQYSRLTLPSIPSLSPFARRLYPYTKDSEMQALRRCVTPSEENPPRGPTLMSLQLKPDAIWPSGRNLRYRLRPGSAATCRLVSVYPEISSPFRPLPPMALQCSFYLPT